MEVKKFLKYGDLNQTYGHLLSNKQKNYLKLYFEDNYTFEEIGKLYNVSKQAVFDVFSRGIRKLEVFESRLQVVRNKKAIKDAIKKYPDLADTFGGIE